MVPVAFTTDCWARRDPGRVRFAGPRWRPLAWSFVVLGVIIGAAVWGLTHVGYWLVVADPLEHADAVVVLGGGIPFRAVEAATIYRQRWAREIWLTQDVSPEVDIALESSASTSRPSTPTTD